VVVKLNGKRADLLAQATINILGPVNEKVKTITLTTALSLLNTKQL
jgi:hypothetical protein